MRTPARGGRDDAGLPRPGDERDLPRAASDRAGREGAGEHRQGPRDEDQSRDGRQRRERLVSEVVEGEVRAQRDEDEHHHQVGRGGDERAHVALALGVHPETQLVHVGHDQPGDEGPEVAAPAGEVDREVPTGDDEQDGDPGRLAPEADAPLRDDEGEQHAEGDAQAGRDGDVRDELPERIGERVALPEHVGRDCESQHRPRRIVQGRLRDDRLPHLRAQAHPLEERDEDGGISGGEDSPHEQARLKGQVERERGDRAGHHRCEQDPGHGERARDRPRQDATR